MNPKTSKRGAALEHVEPKILVGEPNHRSVPIRRLKSRRPNPTCGDNSQCLITRETQQGAARGAGNHQHASPAPDALRFCDVNNVMTEAEYGQAYLKEFTYTVRILLSCGMNFDMAEELCQWAWVRGWERREQLRNHRNLRQWILKIALNRRRDTYRRDEELRCVSFPSYELNIDSAIDLSTLLQHSTPEERSLLEGQLEGWSTEELSRLYGITKAAAYKRLQRGRKALRSVIDNPGVRRRQNGKI
jgi:DNA-directed RNA polymerase specialized sigma24 family protein